MDLIQSAGRLVLATIAGQLLFFILSPALTAKYGAGGFGIFALCYAIVSVGSNLATLKIEALIVAAKSQFIAEELVAASLICALLTTCVGFCLWRLAFSQILSSGAMQESIEWTAMIATVAQAWVNVLSAFATRHSLFVHLAINKFLTFGAIAIFGLYLPTDFCANGLVFSVLISATLQLFVLLIPLKRYLVRISYVKYQFDTKQEVKSAICLIFPATALDTISQQLPIFIISSAFGSVLLGMYALAARIVYAPFSSISGAVSAVFIRDFSKANFEGKKSILLGAWRLLAILSAAIYLPVMMLGPVVFQKVYGIEWEIAGQMTRVLALMVFFNMIFSPTSASFVALGLMRVPVIAAASAFVYRLTAFILGMLFDSILMALYLFCFFEIVQILLTNRYLVKNLEVHQI